jgi:hypothetical protein
MEEDELQEPIQGVAGMLHACGDNKIPCQSCS